ncbi:uncharacterized protein [Drosophila virilis]|uniref:uncharacterized protein n=1 Tax=Drosophila virilis TaxID=7244 RepID=UPI0038B30370
MSIPYGLSALRNISGFRTVSDEAAIVLAGMLPVDILAKEMEKISMARIATGDAVSMDVIRSEKVTSMATWQERWNTANMGRWTHKLIPNLEQWIRRRNGEMNFHLTQFFTGHGGYRKYQCSRFREVVGSVPQPEGLVAFMLEGEDKWSNISQLIISIQRDDVKRRDGYCLK